MPLRTFNVMGFLTKKVVFEAYLPATMVGDLTLELAVKQTYVKVDPNNGQYVGIVALVTKASQGTEPVFQGELEVAIPVNFTGFTVGECAKIMETYIPAQGLPIARERLSAIIGNAGYPALVMPLIPPNTDAYASMATLH